MKEYLYEYEWNGATYGLTIRADSPLESKYRASAIERGLTYKGEIMATVKVATSEHGWWARFIKLVSGAGR